MGYRVLTRVYDKNTELACFWLQCGEIYTWGIRLAYLLENLPFHADANFIINELKALTPRDSIPGYQSSLCEMEVGFKHDHVELEYQIRVKRGPEKFGGSPVVHVTLKTAAGSRLVSGDHWDFTEFCKKRTWRWGGYDEERRIESLMADYCQGRQKLRALPVINNAG